MQAMVERTEPAYELGERDMLEAWLEYHRQTLAWKCEGLTEAQLRERSVPPSSMSLLGLVRHMADVELNWFRRALSEQPDTPGLFWTIDNQDGDFNDVDDASIEEAFAAWEAECANAREVAKRMELDDAGTRRGEKVTLRWVYVHMIEEYARHNGHADFLRERIDGATGD
jgi:uncharacterized damage-inducible protein DinB